jgi:exosortase/archaeosortase family protein
LVGIDEACSGVRSVQTTLFASLFLGELYRFASGRRLGLTLAGIAVALAANLARTSFLVWCASRRGLDQMHRWHDTAGLVALAATMAGLWALAQMLRGKKPMQPGAAVSQSWARTPSRWVLFCLAAWILMAEVGTEFWYHAHELQTVQNSHWSVDWPAAQSDFGEIPISDTVRAMLRYSEGREVAWRDDAANQWLLFLFRWAPGRNSAQLAKTHTPDICLRGVGYQLAEDLGTIRIQTQDLELPFSRRVFTRGGESPLYVFYCLWEERESLAPQAADGLLEDGVVNIKSRLLAIREGRRHLGQQVLEVAIRGPASAEEAAAVFQNQISRLIRRQMPAKSLAPVL